MRLKLNDDERDLVLAGLFELSIARAEDEELGARVVALVERLGGDRYAVFFGAYDLAAGRPVGVAGSLISSLFGPPASQPFG